MSFDCAGNTRRAVDNRFATAHDASLFHGDGFDIVTEPTAVIQRDIRDQASVGLHRVDGVEPSAHTDLEQPCIDSRGVESDEACQRAEFKKRQRRFAAGRFHSLECGDDRLVRRGRAVDADPFVVAMHMR